MKSIGKFILRTIFFSVCIPSLIGCNLLVSPWSYVDGKSPLATNTPSSSLPQDVFQATQAITNQTPENGQPPANEDSTLAPNIKPNPDEQKPPFLYYTQSGDHLNALASHFEVNPSEITSPDPIPEKGFIKANQLMIIPRKLDDYGPSELLLPDSEFLYSPTVMDFDTISYIENTDGYLKTQKDYVSIGELSGAEIVQRAAINNSVNPRLVLSIMEYMSHWVLGKPANLAEEDYPCGYKDFTTRGLNKQLTWCIEQLSVGYYGWRNGTLKILEFPDGTKLRIAPELNAGSVALQYLFSKVLDERQWGGALYGPESIMVLHKNMFGDPWTRAQMVEPLFPSSFTQPVLELPFPKGETWNYTGGPHPPWGEAGAVSAVDFAPPADAKGCIPTPLFVTASAAGLVVRSAYGIVMIDMDGDGNEQTGWVLFYLHISNEGRIPVGTWVNTGDQIGHPSCEGGISTGTHVHFSRKYNGEWIDASGPIPFTLSGWTAKAGAEYYLGTMTKGNKVATANTYSTSETKVVHE